MTQEETKATVLRILGEIAPEADLSRLKPDVSFRDQLDIDSMDFLNFVIALDEELDVGIPESEYPKLSTLEGCIGLLTQAVMPSTQVAQSPASLPHDDNFE
ncbi:MAG TPA: phosphopantetheine-binding protein [Pyrinomonadaceae bacterium]|nr:phosphopantetheine-binding protein [Pyrinomonadaceae bacterium]